MEGKINFKKPINTLKSEHLNEGVKPIRVCIGIPKDFKITHNELTYRKNIKNPEHEEIIENFGLQNPENIRWSSFPGYIMSEIDDNDKISKYFSRCTGLVIKGIDKESKRNISLLTHQAGFVLHANQESAEHFRAELEKRLIEIKKRCIPGTIDSIIIGGDGFDNDYSETIGILSKEVVSILGFEPVVINGPKINYGEDNIYYENENGRLYFVRPEVNQGKKDFIHSNIDKEENIRKTQK